MPEAPTLDAQKVVDFITLASTALEKAAEADQAHEAQSAATARLIPQAVAAMVDNRRIQPEQAEKLAAVLKDPVQAIELLIKTAAHRNDAELAEDHARLGRPAGGAAAPPLAKRAFVGQRSALPAPSDLKFLADLGLPAPRE